MGLPDGEEIMTLASFLRFDTIPARDRRRDRQTDGRTDGRTDTLRSLLRAIAYMLSRVKTDGIVRPIRCTHTGWLQRSKPQSFVHIFCQILTDCQNFFIGAFCGKFAIKWLLWLLKYHYTLTVSLHYLVKYKICKIHHYLPLFGE